MVYHDVPQPYRIQKRLALNQCFRTIRAEFNLPERFVYVTFGGRDLYDAMDLVSVFNVREHEIGIVSYEQDHGTAIACRSSPVATTLSRIGTVSVDIIIAQFPSSLERLHELRPNRTFVYFLDYTGTFKDNEAATFLELLESGLLRAHDFVLITSCLSARVLHNERLMTKYDSSFRLLFRPGRLDVGFRDRNLVDLLVNLSLSRFEKTQPEAGTMGFLGARLLGKYKYQDSRAPMGLWLYRIEPMNRRIAKLADVRFDEFPVAFSKPQEPEIPNIFD
jgi:hypothetical protein